MNQSKISDIAPFKMFGNLYFVGSSRVSVHLIDTEEGLVLIDTGYPEMYEQILFSIELLGFAPKNIVAIFHSHGHIDHFGTTLKLKEFSEEKVDLVMGNHAGQNDTRGKLKRVQEGCTDITDPDEWQKLLKTNEIRMLEMLEKENKQ